MRFVLLTYFMLAAPVLASQEDCNCQTQLVRMEIQGQTLQSLLTSSDSLKEMALPSLENFLQSETFRSKVVADYPVESRGFPHLADLCQKEKGEGDPDFQNIDCTDGNICSDPSISEAVKTEVCVALPCALIKGSMNMEQCPPQSVARPSRLHFPQPVSVKKISMTPTSISTENNALRACFTINEMELNAGVGIEFSEDAQVSYDRLALENLNITLDSSREVCLSAKLNLGASNPLTEIKIERPQGNFLSDNMISRSLSGVTVSGLSGYSPSTMQILRLTAAPALARHFRPSLEDAVSSALARTFETQVEEFVTGLNKNSAPARIETSSDSFISEMGVANIAVKKYVDLIECSLLKNRREPVPANHPCLSHNYIFKEAPLKLKHIPSPEEAALLIQDQFRHNDQVTSEALRVRLLALENEMRSPELSQIFQNQIRPLADTIAKNQLNSSLISGLELVSRLGDENSMTGFGLSIPDICDALAPSPHAGRSIQGCPIQTYIDLNEVNNLLSSMFESGRLCHQGRGHFRAEVNSRGEVLRHRDGAPRGSGCLFRIEENEDGMRCYLNGAPQLKYDEASGGYKVELKTKECFRGSVALGQGKIGGDINFEIGFTPSICGQNEFCLENGQANWNVVDGTARHALRERSFFNGMVRRKIDEKLNGLIKETIRIPLSTSTGPMSMIPLEAEGRIDKGAGFFGACLKVKD